MARAISRQDGGVRPRKERKGKADDVRAPGQAAGTLAY